MTITSEHVLDPTPASRQPTWYLLYFLLAAFDILTVCISLSISHRLIDMHTRSVETNRVWADRLSAYAELGALATQTNAPGNDVFLSRIVDEEAARLDAEVAAFSYALNMARQDLQDHLATAADLTVYLDRAEAAMQKQVAEARSIFTHLRSNDEQHAGERMAAMDRAFSDVSGALALLTRDVQGLQQQELEAQAAIAVSMQRAEYVIAALIAVMISLAVLYGRKLAQRARQTDSQMQDFAFAAEESAARANQHSEALTEALARLETQTRATNEHPIVAITDSSGKIIYANDTFCKVSKYSQEELIGQDHRIVNAGYHPRSFFVEMWKTIAAGGVWRGEVCNLAKDGSRYWVDTTIVPFTDDSGPITQNPSTRTEFTDRKRTESAPRDSAAAAEAATRAKSDLLANMCHEIRTPMTAILGFVENMADGDQSEPRRIESIRTIRRNGEYLLGIINDLLDLSRIEAGRMTVERRECKPCRIVADVCSLMHVQADEKGLRFSVEHIGAIPETIECDATRLRQILINLLGNAINFTETGAVRLVVSCVGSADSAYLQFDVIDTGRGMTPQQQNTLFQPFSQADTSLTREFGGTGLGLTISKRFAELLGGGIVVAETEVGVGSTFRASVATGPLQGTKMLDDPMAATDIAHPAGAGTQ